MTPVLRVATGGAVALTVLLIGGGVGYYLNHREPDLKTTGTHIASAPSTRPSLPGDRQLPDSEQAYQQFEQQTREAAEKKSGSAAAVPPINPLDSAPTLIPTPPPQVTVEWQRQQREMEREQKKEAVEREKIHQEAIKHQAQGMGKVLANWGGTHKTVEASLKPPEPPKPEPIPVADPLASLSVDHVYYGVLQVFISSDEPGPIVVTLKDGELAGARLIGSFKRADEKVTIQFDRMTFHKAWYSVDAVAINPENGRLGLATDVDRRTFSRWAALLGSAVLQGAQRAYLNQGTQSSYLWGETSTHHYSDKEILGIALGEIGTRTRNTATRYFERPPTVYVDPALQLVGVLFLAPPSRKTEGGVLARSDPSQLTQTQEILKAAEGMVNRQPRSSGATEAVTDETDEIRPARRLPLRIKADRAEPME
ncbi:MAG: DotG/IcmE/VirB10 family protein [Candidatus Competibacter denitrificans]